MTSDPPSSAQRLAWHYTSAARLVSILESHKLRATSAAFMNDANEMRTGTRALRAGYDRIEKSLSPAERDALQDGREFKEGIVDHLYLLSASKRPDLLTLWRNYGGSTLPYAIGLDRGIHLRPVERVCGKHHPHPPEGWAEEGLEETDDGTVRAYSLDEVWTFGGRWRDVTYVVPDRDSGHEASVREIARTLSEAKADGAIVVDMSRFADSDVFYEKDASFEDEKEVRIIVEASPAWKFIHFRDSPLGVVPFVELSHSEEGREFIPHNAKRRLPIREVWIGPTPEPEIARRALDRLLEVTGYGDVPVKVSTTPYR